jgi:hypothetical protein
MSLSGIDHPVSVGTELNFLTQFLEAVSSWSHTASTIGNENHFVYKFLRQPWPKTVIIEIKRSAEWVDCIGH